jgi:hypothetical protein
MPSAPPVNPIECKVYTRIGDTPSDLDATVLVPLPPHRWALVSQVLYHFLHHFHLSLSLNTTLRNILCSLSGLYFLSKSFRQCQRIEVSPGYLSPHAELELRADRQELLRVEQVEQVTRLSLIKMNAADVSSR